jgi:plasmid stabilization system protein ParE
MANAEIVWTEESKRWLRVIWEYIARDSVTAADKTIDGIWEKAQMLSRFPEAGFKYPLAGRDDVRVLVFGNYRIAFTLNDPNIVTVLGVFHAALDIDRYFPED